MPLPPRLAWPVQVALARSVEQIPDLDALPGGSRYEPKWDGFRAVVARDEGGARVWSRRGTDLSLIFPEITEATAVQLERGTVLDGEIVIWSAGQLDFEALQERMGLGARSAAAHARQHPASLALFDVLVADGLDVRDRPFDERRALLEDLAVSWRPPLNLSPVTADRDVAAEWFETYSTVGIDGLVIKGGSQRYPAGQRAWLKVKRRRTIDVVCGAVIGTITSPQQVVAGLPIDGKLRIVGHTGPLSAAARRALVPWLTPPLGEHPWPRRVRPGTLYGRFNVDRSQPVDLTLVEPIVVEVSADAAWSGAASRHALRLVRVRPELNPVEVSPPSNTA